MGATPHAPVNTQKAHVYTPRTISVRITYVLRKGEILRYSLSVVDTHLLPTSPNECYVDTRVYSCLYVFNPFHMIIDTYRRKYLSLCLNHSDIMWMVAVWVVMKVAHKVSCTHVYTYLSHTSYSIHRQHLPSQVSLPCLQSLGCTVDGCYRGRGGSGV
jgi:hypothetical protein